MTILRLLLCAAVALPGAVRAAGQARAPAASAGTPASLVPPVASALTAAPLEALPPLPGTTIADPAAVEAFYEIGVAKDLSLFRGSSPGRGYAMIIDDNDDLPAVAAAAPLGAFRVHTPKKFWRGQPDEERVALWPELVGAP